MAEEHEERNEQEERLEALFAELKSMKEENQALRKDVVRLSYVKPKAPEGDGPEPTLSMEGMPDMQVDPEGWAKEYAKRAEAVAEAKANRTQKRTTSEADKQKRVSELWEKFQKDYPELAKDEDKVGLAVQKAMRRGDARGYDMDRYMFGHTDLFFEEVVEEYKKAFGPMTPAAPEPEEPSEGESNDAAWGIFGGSMGEDSGKGKKEKGEKLGSFSEDIKAFQRKAGYAW